MENDAAIRKRDISSEYPAKNERSSHQRTFYYVAAVLSSFLIATVILQNALHTFKHFHSFFVHLPVQIEMS